MKFLRVKNISLTLFFDSPSIFTSLFLDFKPFSKEKSLFLIFKVSLKKSINSLFALLSCAGDEILISISSSEISKNVKIKR